jgi:ABC-type phosphate transport system substrate-binding protein
MNIRTNIARRLRKAMIVTTLTTAALGAFSAMSTTTASASNRADWSFVGRDQIKIDGITSTVPTYVNQNSIEGSRDNFTITYQARYRGRQGIDRVNIGVVVDCVNSTAEIDQMYVYRNRGNHYDYYTSGVLGAMLTSDAFSHCNYAFDVVIMRPTL